MAEFQFKITPCAEDGKIEQDSLLVVRVSFATQPVLQIEVHRSFSQVQELLRDLSVEFKGSAHSSSDVTPTIDRLELLLNQLVASSTDLNSEPWNCQVLMVFLDNAPMPSCFNNATFRLMKNKITSLDLSAKRSQLQVDDLQNKYFELTQQVQVIQQWMQIQHHEHSLSNQRSPAPHASLAVPSASPVSSPDGPRRGNFPASSSDSDSAETGGHQLPVLNVPSGNKPFDNDSPCPSSSTQASGTTDFSLRKPNDAGSQFNATAPEFSPLGGSSKSAVTVTSPSPGVFPSSQYLPSSAYAQIATEDPLNQCMEELVVAISPQQAQVQYRDSIVALLQRNIRNVLNCEAFEVGLHRLLCFLPDDPVKVSAVVCRNHSTKWHRVICDRLNLVAKRKSEELAGEGYTYRTDRPEEGLDESSGDHIIRNVVISNTKLNILVQCSIDQLEVELTCNSRADVCMLALLEEIAMLVGKNDLFQRSLQVIRAWWNYECAAYVGTSIKYYLSDFALCLMVAAIFNQHHTRINTPLQALCAFLAEYSQYDGTTSAITLMGIVPFKSATSNQPVVAPQLHPALAPTVTPSVNSANGFLLGPETLERYWLLFCPPDASNPEQQQLKIFSALSSSSEDVQGMELAGVAIDFPVVPNTATANALNAISEVHDAPSVEEAALASHRQACARNLAKFDRSQFNIVDPFSCNNMLVERPSQNRIARLMKVFQTGAQQMFGVLTQLAQRPTANPRDTIGAFFPQTTARFMESLVRPDTFNVDNTFVSPTHLAMLTRKIPMKVAIEDLARQMRYCNLMVESVISRSAVLDLVVEILTQKGPLPIGEVGKALAELTCITGLSSRLKEAYGGLKKFLEDFSSVVIIGTDHPFNPHIVLRSSLSPENLAMNDSGVFPTNVVLRMKKITATSLRKTSFGTTANKLPVPQQGMNVPQHPAYRSGGPALAGVGIGGIVDNRAQMYNQGPRHNGMAPQPFSTYTQQQQQQGQGQGPGQGQANGQQMNHSSANSPQYTYNAKILSNLNADARDREVTSGARSHAIQNSVYSGAPKVLEKRPSGGSHGGNAYGSFAEAGGRNDPYEDVLGAPPAGAAYHHQGQGQGQGQGGNQGMDLYNQRSPPPYQESSPEIRMRMQAYPQPSPPNPARPMHPQQQQQQQQQMPRGYGQPELNGFAPQSREFYHGQQQQQQSPQMQQLTGRPEYSFDGPQQGRSSMGAPSPNLYTSGNFSTSSTNAVSGRDYPASPSTSSQSGFAMDSYFDAPLNDSFSQSGIGSRPSSIRSNLSTPAQPPRFDDSLDLSLFQGLGGGNTSSGAGLQGQSQNQGSRSLLSGLRQGTVELLSESSQGQGQGWDQFQQPQGTSPDWRLGDRKY